MQTYRTFKFSATYSSKGKRIRVSAKIHRCRNIYEAEKKIESFIIGKVADATDIHIESVDPEHNDIFGFFHKNIFSANIILMMLFLSFTSCSSAQFCKYAMKKCDGYVDSVVTVTTVIDTFYITRDTTIYVPLPDDNLFLAVMVNCDSLGRAQLKEVRDSSKYILSTLEITNGVLKQTITLREEEFEHQLELKDMVIRELTTKLTAKQKVVVVEKKKRGKWDQFTTMFVLVLGGLVVLMVVWNVFVKKK
jgi:hypothetical protein